MKKVKLPRGEELIETMKSKKKPIFLVELSFQLHAQYPLVIEFDIYPIDIYRQKTDDYFIGTLNIYQINTQNSTIVSTNNTLVSDIKLYIIQCRKTDSF